MVVALDVGPGVGPGVGATPVMVVGAGVVLSLPEPNRSPSDPPHDATAPEPTMTTPASDASDLRPRPWSGLR
ncbi:hypothetical protein BN381_80053 [Candidatus Microthrix parvicella RN1]|uniref:Uncharacterized protein n=1 Tax=Candidatus Neomicrothrix parvicella RN1 TaxID=1229780 RepID=R4Z463_9ACTN|nr:hypothetical protein BN381_80053 [Candidatus Microthrix parvicella RN1]